MAHELPPLPYPNNALEPHIDAQTMEIHHDRHHKAYVDNLNKAIAVLGDFRNSSDIPGSIWSKAHCVLVIPSLKKAGFIVAGESGSGVMSCRQSNGSWGPTP